MINSHLLYLSCVLVFSSCQVGIGVASFSIQPDVSPPLNPFKEKSTSPNLRSNDSGINSSTLLPSPSNELSTGVKREDKTQNLSLTEPNNIQNSLDNQVLKPDDKEKISSNPQGTTSSRGGSNSSGSRSGSSSLPTGFN